MTQFEARTRAYNAGMARAIKHQSAELYPTTTEPVEYDEDDYDTRKDIIGYVTTEKVDPDSQEGDDIVTEFLQGYYDYWDEEN